MNKKRLFKDFKRKMVVEALKKAHEEVPEQDDELRASIHETFCHFCTDKEYDDWVFLGE